MIIKQIICAAILLCASYSIAFSQSNENSCPTVKISYSDIVINEHQILIFSAGFNRPTEYDNLKYKWTAENGRILAGQDTGIVAILREYYDSGKVTVEVSGLPKNCSNKASEEFFRLPVCPVEAMQVDEYDKITEVEEKERLDVLLIALENNPSAKAVIKLRLNESSIARLKFLSNYITLKGYKNRVLFFVDGAQARLTKSWIVPDGADSPDCKDCIIIKAEDFDKLEKLFQPKTKTKNRKK